MIVLHNSRGIPAWEIDDYISYAATMKFYDSGNFELEIPYNAPYANDIVNDRYVTIDVPGHKETFIIEKISAKFDQDNGRTIVVTGRDTKILLDRRIIWPKLEYEDQPAARIAESLVNWNVVRPADEARKLPITVTPANSPAILSAKHSAMFYGESLYMSVVNTLKPAGLGFELRRSYANNKESFNFKVLLGRDLTVVSKNTRTVVFTDELDNVTSTDFVRSIEDYRTYAYVKGETYGEEPNRKNRWTTISTGPASAKSGKARREIAVDASSLSSKDGEKQIATDAYMKMLQRKGREELDKHKYWSLFSGDIIDGVIYNLGVDYRLGDIVLVMNDSYGYSGPGAITEIVVSDGPEGPKYSPVVSFDESVDKTYVRSYFRGK